MPRLGQLERAVMEFAWERPITTAESTFTVRDVAGCLPDHAYTTVMTIVERLSRKGLLERVRSDRAYHYRATSSREAYVAELMHEALASTADRSAALVHFAESVSPDQAEILRQVLNQLGGTNTASSFPRPTTNFRC